MKNCGLILLVFLAGCQSAQHDSRKAASERKPSNQVRSIDELYREKSGGSEARTSDLVTLEHPHYTVKYHPEFRLAQQVEYTLTGADLRNENAKRKNRFRPDPLLKKKNIFAAEKKDISGDYDRGHMAPADDFKRSQKALDETFYMTNIAPQKPELNQQAWRRLEVLVQSWACGEEKIMIITGPILKAGLPKLASQISIPEKFYKAIYDLSPPEKAICFIYDQDDDRSIAPEDRMMTIEDCEKILGFDLGPRNLEGTEKDFDFKKWQAAKCN